MIRYLLGIGLLFNLELGLAAKPAGFLWYNLPKEVHQNVKKQPGVPFSQLSYTDKDAVLKFYTMESLHKVRFTHDLEDERAFLALQDFWLKEASIHGRINQVALLKYPQYDFSVTHPNSAIGLKLKDSLEYEGSQKRLQTLAKEEGVLFFYRGDNPYDQKQIPILLDFCKRHGFKLVSLSVDGANSELLKGSKNDKGQADFLKIRYFPAILLANPKKHTTRPIAYGLTTQDILEQRIKMLYPVVGELA